MKRILLNILLITILLQGCSMIKIKITVSDKRNPKPQSIELPNDIIITTWGTVKINKKEWFPSSFMIEAQGKVFYIDPLMIGETTPADYIFITHAHPDHLSIKDIEKIVKEETLIICPKNVAKKLSKYKIREVKPDDILNLDNIKCEAVEAYNLNRVFLWIKAHPKSKQNVGYILTIDGTKIYHAGDTDFIPEMKNIKDITVALVPVGGDNLTMDIEQASNMINTLKPMLVIPMHYDPEKKENLINFKKRVEKSIQVKFME
ncbi:MAG TPA: MBL fold metallo-hydrolase [Candidatus Cloacimonetes bacterium]|nr:MBL fold metallo-hydrolase [Candidatus Cloacimonadota bacterium]